MFFRQKRELSPPEVTFEEAKGSDVLGIRPFSSGMSYGRLFKIYIYIYFPIIPVKPMNHRT